MVNVEDRKEDLEVFYETIEITLDDPRDFTRILNELPPFSQVHKDGNKLIVKKPINRDYYVIVVNGHASLFVPDTKDFVHVGNYSIPSKLYSVNLESKLIELINKVIRDGGGSLDTNGVYFLNEEHVLQLQSLETIKDTSNPIKIIDYKERLILIDDLVIRLSEKMTPKELVKTIQMARKVGIRHLCVSSNPKPGYYVLIILENGKTIAGKFVRKASKDELYLYDPSMRTVKVVDIGKADNNISKLRIGITDERTIKIIHEDDIEPLYDLELTPDECEMLIEALKSALEHANQTIQYARH
jgi:hypothetical protein